MLEVLIGIVFGTLGGMGLGGGMVLIPALTIFLGVTQHAAQGVNLLAFLPTAALAIITHAKEKRIDFKATVKMGIPGIVGAVGGAFIALNLDATLLRKAFGVFLIALALYQLISYERSEKKRIQEKNDAR